MEFLTATCDGDLWNIYLNGELVSSMNNSISNINYRSNFKLRFGNSPHANESEFFNGKIDDVSIWNIALSQRDSILHGNATDRK